MNATIGIVGEQVGDKYRVFIRVDLPSVSLEEAKDIYKKIKELVQKYPNNDVEMNISGGK